MSVSFHINFDGRCAEAFQFYEKHLGGVIGSLLTYGDSPVRENVPDTWQDKILHGSISIDNIEIAGTDTLLHEYQKPAGFCILVRVTSEQRIQSLFSIFKKGGEVILPPQKNFLVALLRHSV
jgi:PhnB protein